MAAFLFVTWAGGGNVPPALVLADGLADRGHRVGVVAPESLRLRFEAVGAEVVAAPSGWLADADLVLEAADGYAPDVVVVDYMLTAALCAAERIGAPTVALVHTLYGALVVDGAPNPMGRAGSAEDVNAVRSGLGLDPIDRLADLLTASDLVLVSAPAELDTADGVPAGVVYAGPLVEPPGPDAGWLPPAGPGPLVVVSMGTAGSDPVAETEVLRHIVGALGTLVVRGFVSVPDAIDAAALDAPANVTVTGYVRHAAVLPHADLVITHAGLGTVAAALAHGVRLLCLPLDRDQPANARAVDRLGRGATLDARAGVDDIRRAVEHALGQPQPGPVVVDPAAASATIAALAAPAGDPAAS